MAPFLKRHFRKLFLQILAHKSQEEGSNGITQNVFSVSFCVVFRGEKKIIFSLQRCLFPRYPVLAEKFFLLLHEQANAKHAYISVTSFKHQCERYLGVSSDRFLFFFLFFVFLLFCAICCFRSWKTI